MISSRFFSSFSIAISSSYSSQLFSSVSIFQHFALFDVNHDHRKLELFCSHIFHRHQHNICLWQSGPCWDLWYADIWLVSQHPDLPYSAAKSQHLRKIHKKMRNLNKRIKWKTDWQISFLLDYRPFPQAILNRGYFFCPKSSKKCTEYIPEGP